MTAPGGVVTTPFLDADAVVSAASAPPPTVHRTVTVFDVAAARALMRMGLAPDAPVLDARGWYWALVEDAPVGILGPFVLVASLDPRLALAAAHPSGSAAGEAALGACREAGLWATPAELLARAAKAEWGQVVREEGLYFVQCDTLALGAYAVLALDPRYQLSLASGEAPFVAEPALGLQAR